ncbi:hypothetical protein P3L10_007864 [Capsicum annuum]
MEIFVKQIRRPASGLFMWRKGKKQLASNLQVVFFRNKKQKSILSPTLYIISMPANSFSPKIPHNCS